MVDTEPIDKMVDTGASDNQAADLKEDIETKEGVISQNMTTDNEQKDNIFDEETEAQNIDNEVKVEKENIIQEDDMDEDTKLLAEIKQIDSAYSYITCQQTTFAPPFTNWGTEYQKKQEEESKKYDYIWCNAAMMEPDPILKRQIEYRHRLLDIARRHYTVVRQCADDGEGRCYLELFHYGAIPHDAPFRWFIHCLPHDLNGRDCSCVLEKCRNFRKCGGLAPKWYLNNNNFACPDCVKMLADFIRIVAPVNLRFKGADDLLPPKERTIHTSEPYLVEFSKYNVSCDTCGNDNYGESFNFSNCWHQLCLRCAFVSGQEDSLVCAECFILQSTICACEDQKCDGQCMLLFQQKQQLELTKVAVEIYSQNPSNAIDFRAASENILSNIVSGFIKSKQTQARLQYHSEGSLDALNVVSGQKSLIEHDRAIKENRASDTGTFVAAWLFVLFIAFMISRMYRQ